MGMIKVTSEELQTLSGQVANGSVSIQDQLTRLAGEVTSVAGAEWQGAASSQFTQLWTEWQTSAHGLRDALDGISRLLAQAGTQYEATEQAIRASF